ncbi:MAPK/MAK/MRK overlapping kinase, partial [Mesitornis unicolor]
FLAYKPVGKIGEGTFSDVLKVLNLRDGKYYACKVMKQHFESMEKVNNLEEIRVLSKLSPHPNIVTLYEVIFDKKAGTVSLILELMGTSIYELIKGRTKPLPEKKITNYMYQLCKALDYIHRNGIFHRDIKPENILIKKNTLKLGDFGSCRSDHSEQPYTEYISTRWYRAPECLLTTGYYGCKIDIWSAGCVFYEITSLEPLFPGSNELDQISIIHDVLGTPPSKTLNKFKQSRFTSFDFPYKKGMGIPPLVNSLSPQGFSLLCAMIEYDPDERIAAHQALQHPYFHELRQVTSNPFTERQALATHIEVRLSGNMAGQIPLHPWQIPKESQRQHSLRKGQGKPNQHHGPSHGLPDFPKLSLSGPAMLPSCPAPALPSICWAPKRSGAIPVFQPGGFPGAHGESEKQKALKSPPKYVRFPVVDRRGGGF